MIMQLSRLLIIGFSALLLTACHSYKVDVDLTDEQIEEVKGRVDSLKAEIEAFVPTELGASIPWQSMIELSRAYEEMGELGKALKVYEDAYEQGEWTKSMLNNLGKLYEKTEQYDKAVVIYQRIIDEYFDRDYLYNITWAYIRAGERKEAEKYFNAWQLEFNKTDEQTQQAIKKLREAEKAEEDAA